MEDSLPIYDVLENHGDFIKFLQLVDTNEDIRDKLLHDSVTIFAPTDDAFEEIEDLISSKNMRFPAFLAEENTIKEILLHHIAEQVVMSDEILSMNGQNIKLLDGQSIRVKLENNAVTVGGATLVETDHEASNGVIHGINKIMFPENFNF